MIKDEEGSSSICLDDHVDYKAIVSVINEGVVILQAGRIIHANPAFCAMITQSRDTILGSPFSDIVSKGERRRVAAYIETVSSIEQGRGGVEFRLERDSQRTLEMKLSVIRYHGKEAVLGALSDITERRKERIEIQRLHSRLRSIIDSMRHVVLSFSYDDEADKAEVRDFAFYDRHLMEINPAAEALFGVPRADFINKSRSIFDFVHDKDKEKVLSHYNNLFEEGIGELTYRVVGPINEVRWVLDYGRVEYLERGRVRRINHIIEDITTEKNAVDELMASEEKYRRIFERSKDMIYILKPDGSFIDINPAGVELLGLASREEAASRNMKEFHVDLGVRDALVKEIIKNGEVTMSRVLLRNTKGEKIEVDLNLIARRDDSGKVASYQGIVHNITEAIRQKELESIGQLAGCFADDLASPLSVTMMGIEATRGFLAEAVEDMNKWSKADNAGGPDDLIAGVRQKLGETEYFNNEAMLACRDMKARLKEIREQYWKLRKVSDGAGGVIYEREGRTAR